MSRKTVTFIDIIKWGGKRDKASISQFLRPYRNPKGVIQRCLHRLMLNLSAVEIMHASDTSSHHKTLQRSILQHPFALHGNSHAFFSPGPVCFGIYGFLIQYLIQREACKRNLSTQQNEAQRPICWQEPSILVAPGDLTSLKSVSILMLLLKKLDGGMEAMWSARQKDTKRAGDYRVGIQENLTFLYILQECYQSKCYFSGFYMNNAVLCALCYV